MESPQGASRATSDSPKHQSKPPEVSATFDVHHSQSEEPVSSNNRNHDSHPFPLAIGIVRKKINDALTVDFALRRQLGDVFALAFGSATILSAFELVHNHAGEDVGLVVDVVKDVAVKHVETVGGDHEAVAAHPEAVRKSSCSEGDDKDWCDGRDEHDEGFSR